MLARGSVTWKSGHDLKMAVPVFVVIVVVFVLVVLVDFIAKGQKSIFFFYPFSNIQMREKRV